MSDSPIRRLASGRTRKSLKTQRNQALRDANNINKRLEKSYPNNYKQLEQKETNLRKNASTISRKMREMERNKFRAKKLFEQRANGHKKRKGFFNFGKSKRSLTRRSKNTEIKFRKRGSPTRRTMNKVTGFGKQPIGSLPGTVPRRFGFADDDLNRPRELRQNGMVISIKPLPFRESDEGRSVRFKEYAFGPWQSGFKLGKIITMAELLYSDGRPVPASGVSAGFFYEPKKVSREQVKFESVR